MPRHILVEVPRSIEEYHNYLQLFFEGMMKKLDKNSYKSTPTKESLPGIMELLRAEIAEFEAQIYEDKFNENSLIELMDQANFSFLAYVALRLQGVNHGNKPTDRA